MLLEVSDLVKDYVGPAGLGGPSGQAGVLRALDHVSLQVDAGERVGVIGGSGSGKTTLANVVLGLEAPDAGAVRYRGAELAWGRRARQGREGMQLVFQNPASSFPEHMNVGRGVAEGLVYRGRHGRTEVRRRVLEALDLVGLPGSYADRAVWELSGGECQRAAIARAVVGRPDLLVCDEPTSALDVTVQAQVMGLLDDLCRELGMACLFISHDLPLVRCFCQRVYVVEKGRVVEEGPVERVFADPQSPCTRRLVESVPAV